MDYQGHDSAQAALQPGAATQPVEGYAFEEAPLGIHGVIAEFDTPEALVVAAKKAYRAGYRKMDAYAPMPVHGLAEAIGMKKTWLPAVIFCCGLGGALGGFLLQAFAMGHHYAYNVGGRPPVSWPSFIPVTFELGILSAGIAALVGMAAFNRLPQLYHPVFNAKNFERASQDKFFLCIEAEDSKFDIERVTDFLRGLDAVDVSEVPA